MKFKFFESPPWNKCGTDVECGAYRRCSFRATTSHMLLTGLTGLSL
jgi:hypothetical protein